MEEAGVLLDRPFLAEMSSELAAEIDTLESAIASGDTGAAGHTRLLLGISHYHTGNIEASRAAFRRAQADAAFRDEAQAWLDYLGKHQSSPTPEHHDQ